MKQFGFALAALTLLATPALAEAPPGAAKPAGCRMGLIAELPVTFEKNRPTVPVEINGKPLRALLDTGAAKTVISRSAAERLGLQLSEIGEAFGVDGKVKVYFAHIKGLTLMGATTPPLDMAVNGVGLADVDMLIGRDLLARTDIELDLGHGKMRLVHPNDCADDQMAYWTQSWSEVRLITDQDDAFRLDVRINGSHVLAVLDSGAQGSLVSERAAFTSGVPLAEPLPGDFVTGVAGKREAIRRGLVKTLSIGDETLNNVTLDFGAVYSMSYVTGRINTVIAPVEMYLGADFLKAHRVLISHETGKMYFTYNGGPIFHTPLKRPAPPPADTGIHR